MAQAITITTTTTDVIICCDSCSIVTENATTITAAAAAATPADIDYLLKTFLHLFRIDDARLPATEMIHMQPTLIGVRLPITIVGAIAHYHTPTDPIRHCLEDSPLI